MPKVSIIVPIYNVEKYLKECLDSIINQTLKDIEIICIDDGSKDNCPKIIDEYAKKDSRIKVVHKVNSGYGASMNIGLDMASGEFIGIIEPDDFASVNMFEDLYEVAVKNKAEIVKSDWNAYWTKNKQVQKVGRLAKFKANKLTNALEDKSILKIQPSLWSAIYRRDFINKNKIRFLETQGASYQDTSFHFKVYMLAQRVILVKKAYVYYRQDNANSSGKSKAKVYAICDEYNEIEKFINEHKKLIKPFREYIYAIQYRVYWWNLNRIDESYAKDFIEVFSAKFKQYYDEGCLGTYFYRRNGKKELLCLINEKSEFYKIYEKKSKQKSLKDKRRKFISVRINSSRISIVLFGKHILEIG